MVNGAAARDEAWMEYVDTLEDSLTEPKQFVASMTLNQETPTKELLKERKHIKLMMAQNTNAYQCLKLTSAVKGMKPEANFLDGGKV